jgi:membrane protease YdiL (CAAX protease family)
MPTEQWLWRSPPNWPPPPEGWRPQPGWRPPPEWPPPPHGWSYWEAAGTPDWEIEPLRTPLVVADGTSRRRLVWETRWVMVAFLLPAVTAAVILFAQHEAGVANITRFPDLVQGQPVVNLVLGILAYLPVAAMVPLALFLLARTGQPPAVMGLGLPSLRGDLLPGLGIAAAAFGSEFIILIPLAPLLAHRSSLINSVATGHVPGYYVIWGLAVSATTAITEEVLVNGYLITRLGQLGWTPRRALVLSLVLRTSYHVYYGLGFLLTIPFGYLVTRSFQKHRRLTRPIAAHFLFDAVLVTIAILR